MVTRPVPIDTQIQAAAQGVFCGGRGQAGGFVTARLALLALSGAQHGAIIVNGNHAVKESEVVIKNAK